MLSNSFPSGSIEFSRLQFKCASFIHKPSITLLQKRLLCSYSSSTPPLHKHLNCSAPSQALSYHVRCSRDATTPHNEKMSRWSSQEVAAGEQAACPTDAAAAAAGEQAGPTNVPGRKWPHQQRRRPGSKRLLDGWQQSTQGG